MALLAVDWGSLVFPRALYCFSRCEFADSWTRPTRLCARSHRIYRRHGVGVYTLVGAFRNDFGILRVLHPNLTELCVALAVIPVMLFLANLGRRLLQLRIAGMVAEINLARTPDGIQAALRRHWMTQVWKSISGLGA